MEVAIPLLFLEPVAGSSRRMNASGQVKEVGQPAGNKAELVSSGSGSFSVRLILGCCLNLHRHFCDDADDGGNGDDDDDDHDVDIIMTMMMLKHLGPRPQL